MKNFESEAGCSVDAIKHDGVIKKTDDNFYYVSIIAHSACDACHSKSVCNIGTIKEEIIEVPRGSASNYSIGDRVEVKMEKTLGTKAVLLGYFYPFLLLIAMLIITTSLMKNEGVAAILSLVTLIPYYLVLYYLRDRLKKTFTFRVN